jgi:hypothetical protein
MDGSFTGPYPPFFSFFTKPSCPFRSTSCRLHWNRGPSYYQVYCGFSRERGLFGHGRALFPSKEIGTSKKTIEKNRFHFLLSTSERAELPSTVENKKNYIYDTMQNKDIDRELMKLPFTRRRELFEALSVGIAGAN